MKKNKSKSKHDPSFLELMEKTPYEILFQLIGHRTFAKSGQISLQDRHRFVAKKHGSITYFCVEDCELNLENESYVEKRGNPDQLCLWLHLNRAIHSQLTATAFQYGLNDVAICAHGYVLRIDTEIRSLDRHYSEWMDS